jgi:hypothetical protein
VVDVGAARLRRSLGLSLIRESRMPQIAPYRIDAIGTALAIHECLPGITPPINLNLPVPHWNQLMRMAGHLQHAHHKHWDAAHHEVARRLVAQLGSLMRCLETTQLALVSGSRPVIRPCPSAILADLLALPEEFAEASIDLRAKTITVQTDCIVLDGIDLGPFEIVLHWGRLREGAAYEVNALEPHRPGCDDSVTHPHVRDDQLCEGEGKTAIRSALASARLLDFFLLVRQILRTYNPDSAFTSLSEWEGVSCADCGYTVSGDDSCTCERCYHSICQECGTFCGRCNRLICSDCQSLCSGCDQAVCSDCLHEGNRPVLCVNCSPSESTCDEEPSEQFSSRLEADAVCLGQAAEVA